MEQKPKQNAPGHSTTKVSKPVLLCNFSDWNIPELMKIICWGELDRGQGHRGERRLPDEVLQARCKGKSH